MFVSPAVHWGGVISGPKISHLMLRIDPLQKSRETLTPAGQKWLKPWDLLLVLKMSKLWEM